MSLRDLILQVTENHALYEYLGNFEVLNDTLKIELEDQVYLDVKEIYFLPGTTTVIRVTGKSLVCSKEYHNLCPNAKSWCACTCHENDVEGLTPR